MVNVMLAATMPPSEVAMAVLMGVGIVFAGLVCIIGLCYLMSLIVNKVVDRIGKKKPEAQSSAQSAPVAGAPIANRQEILAAVCAAVAEEEGTDISAIRVVSFKKL